jgi:hypothetical protein
MLANLRPACQATKLIFSCRAGESPMTPPAQDLTSRSLLDVSLAEVDPQ